VRLLRQASREHTPSRLCANDNHVVSHSILSSLDFALWCARCQYTPGLGLQQACIHGPVAVMPHMVPWGAVYASCFALVYPYVAWREGRRRDATTIPC
jgi:hypothetical protein